MITPFVILIISFLAMTAMLVARLYEIKAGRLILAVRARESIEKHTRRGAHAVRDIARVATTKKFWTCLVTFIGHKFVEKVWHNPRVKSVTKKATDVVRGKKEIKSTGPVSFYLKDVSDYKNNNVRSQ